MKEEKSVKEKVVNVGIIVVILVFAIIMGFLKQDFNLKMIQETTILSSSEGTLVDNVTKTLKGNLGVINVKNSSWMFYRFNGDRVSSLKYYYSYESEQEAKEFVRNYQKGKQEVSLSRSEVQEVRQEGRYVVVVPLPSVYQYSTRLTFDETYALLNGTYGNWLSGDTIEMSD